MNDDTVGNQGSALPVIQFGAAVPQSVLDEVDGGKGDDENEQ